MNYFRDKRGTKGHAPPPPTHFAFAPGLRSLPVAKPKSVAFRRHNYFVIAPSAIAEGAKLKKSFIRIFDV